MQWTEKQQTDKHTDKHTDTLITIFCTPTKKVKSISACDGQTDAEP